MKLEIAIISIIVVAGVILFLPQTVSLFPEPPQIINGINQDVSDFQTETKATISQTIDKPIATLNSGLQELKANSIDRIIPQNKEATAESISEDKKQNYEEVSFHGKINDDATAQKPEFINSLSLTIKKLEDNNVVLNYVDTTEKTKNVKVTLRNSEKKLFEGTFFSSKFETFVYDASDTSHFVDMVVENEEYGTITSSVFNPAGNTDTIINGIFTKP